MESGLMYTSLKKCLCCNSKKLSTVLDLGNQHLANSKFEYPGKKFPLILNRCLECSHAQLSIAVDPDLMFRDYPYVSGTSKTLHEFFRNFAIDVVDKYRPKNILDIACNDGTQLDYFKKLGVDTWGIDPASVGRIAGEKGHNIVCDYFGSHLDINKFPKFDVILAQNVFAHNANPHDFLSTAKQMLSENGIILIQTSQADMFANNEFDTIYHEHISFFNPRSMDSLIKRVEGLFLTSVERLNIHGTSFLFTISPKNPFPVQFNMWHGVTEKTYEIFAANAEKIKYDFIAMTSLLRDLGSGYKLIGCGASAKGNTFLNYTKVRLDVIIDDNPLKQGTLTPGMGIPVIPIQMLEYNQEYVFVMLTWNFAQEFKQKIFKHLHSEDEYMDYGYSNHRHVFIEYFPEVRMTYKND